MTGLRIVRHPGESRDPGESNELVVLDSGLRRNDANSGGL